MSKIHNSEEKKKEIRVRLIDRLTYAYFKKIKKRMPCPACKGKMKINIESTLWKCEDCDYELSAEEFEDRYIFWYCDGCGIYLNKQEGFDINGQKWVCKSCGYENNITFSNIKGVCDECGKLLPDPNQSLCEECETARLILAQSILQETAAIFNNAASIVSVVYGLKDSNDSTSSAECTDFGETFDSNDSEYPVCDCCGSSMTEFDGCWWYSCPECGNSVKKNGDGSFTWQREIFGQSSKSNTRECTNCRRSLAGGIHTLPWENDNNPDGYVKCPHCGYINFDWED